MNTKFSLLPNRTDGIVRHRRQPHSLAAANARMRSPLHFPGSKRKLVSTLLKRIPTDWVEFREPFAGGLSMALYLMQLFPNRRYWINDLDPFVSTFWIELATHPDQLCKRLTQYLLEFPSDDNKVCLCEWAKGTIHQAAGVERAALYYVMCRTAFAALAWDGYCSRPNRFNQKGIETLRAVGDFLQKVDLRITNFDYGDCLTDNPEVFTYLDPPYLIAHGLYGEGRSMHTTFDHCRLAKTLLPLKSRWMLSYNDHLLIRHYFRTKHIQTIPHFYKMFKRRNATELVITNYEN